MGGGGTNHVGGRGGNTVIVEYYRIGMVEMGEMRCGGSETMNGFLDLVSGHFMRSYVLTEHIG